MSTKTNVLLVGDDSDAPWHPLEPARRELENILGEDFQVISTENYERFASLDIAEFAFCISYTDCWNRDLTPEQSSGLMRFVAGGGGLLVIHNGISVQRSYELLQMIGGRFTGHPPYQSLNYFGIPEGHPLLEGVGNFQLDEEPYMFEFDPFTPKKVFLEFEFEGNRHPAAWEHHYGLGKIIYLQPGHHAPSFQPESYRRLIRNSARWVAADRG